MKLTELFSAANVRFAYLFGSRSRGTERPDSDTDVAVWFEGETSALARFERACDLQVELERYFATKVDLVVLNDAKPVLQSEAVLRGKALFPDCDIEAVIRFEAQIRQRYEDYSYSQRFFTAARRARTEIQ